MSFTNPNEVGQYIKDTSNADSARGMAVAMRSADDVCMYQGHQWGDAGTVPWVTTEGRVLAGSYNPDSGKLRITQNETTKHVIASYSATDPEDIEIIVPAAPTDGGIEATVEAQVKEYAANACLRNLKFLNRAKHANFMRCVIGTYGIGLRTVTTTRRINVAGNNQMMRDSILSCFTFHPIRLILDPWCTANDLNDHNIVTYGDVWTIDMIRTFFPDVKIDPDQMATVSELAQNELAANVRTRGVLFQQYAYHSRTKGARIYEVYAKDETGRFGQRWCGIAYGRNSDVTILNPDNPTNPFGGNGLPLAMLYGHPRPESNVGISDVGMVKDDQLKLNLSATWEHRYLRNYTNPQVVVDKRGFGRNVNDADLSDKITNQAGGIIPWESKAGDRSVQAPFLLQYPLPPNNLREMQDRYDSKMGEKVFRSELSRGIGLKSHQPDAAVARTLAEGDRVSNVRVASDVLVYQHIAMVALGTVIRGVHEMNPSTLQMLRQDGFAQDDIAVLMNSDPDYPACEVIIPVSSIRRRSSVEKKQALDAAIQAQAVTPSEYRRALAEMDLAASDEDDHMRVVLDKQVAEIIRGLEWQPFPLGNYTDWFLSQLVRARFDRAVRGDPTAIERIGRAYMAQKQFALQQTMNEQIAMNPPPPQPAEASAEEAEPTEEEPKNLGELLERLAVG